MKNSKSTPKKSSCPIPGEDGPLPGATRFIPPVVLAYINEILPDIKMYLYKWYDCNISGHYGGYISMGANI